MKDKMIEKAKEELINNVIDCDKLKVLIKHHLMTNEYSQIFIYTTFECFKKLFRYNEIHSTIPDKTVVYFKVKQDFTNPTTLSKIVADEYFPIIRKYLLNKQLLISNINHDINNLFYADNLIFYVIRNEIKESYVTLGSFDPKNPFWGVNSYLRDRDCEIIFKSLKEEFEKYGFERF